MLELFITPCETKLIIFCNGILLNVNCSASFITGSLSTAALPESEEELLPNNLIPNNSPINNANALAKSSSSETDILIFL